MSVPVSLLTTSQTDKDDLWPNPSSEIAPPFGADATAPEWADRVNAGAGAYSGSWVRQVSAAVSGFWIPTTPGASYYAEAQAKRTAGAGLGGRLNIGFYPNLGSFTGGTVTSGAYSTSGSWTKVSVTSAAAPSGTNAAYISYEAGAGDTVQFDSLLARRVMQPETLASVAVSPTAGTGWTLNTNQIAKTGATVTGSVLLTAGASAAWAAILQLPAGSRPLADTWVMGAVFDSSAGLTFAGWFKIAAANGVLSLPNYDDGTSLVALFAIGTGDQVGLSFSFACF